MNRLGLLMVLCLFAAMPQAWGANRYPNVYRETMWNKLTDGIHTIGQSPRQAALTKSKFRNQRAEKRMGDIKQARRRAWMRGR